MLKKTEEAVLKAVKEELDNNASVLNDNLSLLKQELKVIEKQSIIIPLVTLQSGYWDLIKIHFPKKFEDVNVLNKIRNIAQLTDKINTSIISRESYRIHNQGMTNYTTRLRIYDDDLVENTEKLIDSIGSWDNF